MGIDGRLKNLRSDLQQLHEALRRESYDKHKRINPFCEDLFEWKERGAYWCDQEKNITIYNSSTLSGDVDIGKNTWIGPYCSLDGSGSIRIGEYCSISNGCQIITHDSVKWALSLGKDDYEYGPVKIGKGCFLGSHVVVTKGVTIGDHCVMGAGAVVTYDIPSYSIFGGVPAKPIGQVTINSDGFAELSYF